MKRLALLACLFFASQASAGQTPAEFKAAIDNYCSIADAISKGTVTPLDGYKLFSDALLRLIGSGATNVAGEKVWVGTGREAVWLIADKAAGGGTSSKADTAGEASAKLLGVLGLHSQFFMGKISAAQLSTLAAPVLQDSIAKIQLATWN
jgi:hypothetical protein